MKLPKWLLALGAGLALLIMLAFFVKIEYAYVPPGSKVLSTAPRSQAADLAGQGANDATLQLGRNAFYGETFGNEVFITDIIGLLDGPLTVKSFAKALLQLGGRGTANLQVELDKTVTIGGKTFEKGRKISTGIDVPKGAWAPVGMPVTISGGRVKVGISCAACHATVARDSLKVVEGAPNADLNLGLLMALGTNSAAYFAHTDVDAAVLKRLMTDPKAVEDAVDATFLKWPAGFFDSTIDMKANPAKIPHSFTLGNHPYGWSGFAAAGPFNGLSAFTNNVHAQNSDSLAQADVAPALFGIDKEQYLGIVLQNAANPRYRYNPASGQKPSEFFAAVDPTPGVPGVNEMVKPPSWPRATLIAPAGMFVSSPGTKVWQQNNAMAAWQNTLVAPPAPAPAGQQAAAQGRAVFERAGCMACHAGAFGTNNRVISAPVIGTEPSRAKALSKTERIWGRPLTWSYDTPVPVPPGAKAIRVPTEHLDPEQLNLAWAHGGSPGGYKVQGLMGLYWTAPYLHDGGVAVGPDPETQLGVSGTIRQGIQPDPANSLRALFDRELRRKVIAANQASEDLSAVHVQGIGHEFWVDLQAGFTREEQDALVQYLLSFPR